MEICPIRSCGLLNFCAYGSTYNVIFMFTAELNAQMDELEALLATTARDNNDNAMQNGNSFYIFIRASLQPVLGMI